MLFNNLRVITPQSFNNLILRVVTQTLRDVCLLSLNKNLEELSNAYGVTGREEEVRNLMIKLMKPHVDEIVVDKLENVIAIKKGKKSSPKVMLAAHMGEA